MPEIVAADPLWNTICALVKKNRPKTILEIGSANGKGSTQAFITGIDQAKLRDECRMFCVEANPDHFVQLTETVSQLPFVECINASSIPIGQYMSELQIEEFMGDHQHGYAFNIIRYHNIDTVKKWRNDEIEMILAYAIEQNGIATALEQTGGKGFDMVLIDGSAFTADVEFEMVCGANVIVMDDTHDIKCFNAMTKAFRTGKYTLLGGDSLWRNGFAALGKVS
jgi:hypothetical protein